MPGAEGCRCESEDGVGVVVVDVVAVVVSGVKTLTIKITHSACTFNYPLNKAKGNYLSTFTYRNN